MTGVKTIAEVARDLGIKEAALYNWVQNVKLSLSLSIKTIKADISLLDVWQNYLMIIECFISKRQLA